MKLRFFGDSWYWAWFNKDLLKSKLVRNKIFLGAGLPVLETYFNHLNIECVHKNNPGLSFYETTGSVLATEPIENEDIDYNIICFSNLVRNKEKLAEFDVTNYNNFMDKWEKDSVELLEKLQIWAEQYNQTILLVGCQSTLPKKVFDKIKYKNNLHLLSECVVSQIINEYCRANFDGPFGIFKLAADISQYADTTWDPRLVDHIYEDMNLWDRVIKGGGFLYNDHYHLNPTEHVFLMDLILNKIEQLEGEK